MHLLKRLEKIAESFNSYIWKLHSLPDNLTSNQESQFISEFWKLILCQIYVLMLDCLYLTTYPETDDQTKQINAVTEHYL